ncbi:MAG TPA: ClpXP protease specificity-enhancing factor SspB [Polyangiaceae bacterium]|jgi:stringent starvation protein B|nr:ClpXP protease specificity-enhancing factor SspB [Polyangiaceae bacterium]
MAPTARLPPKKDVALALLEQASMFIHLDPRAEGVQVPAWFKKQPQLVLQIGLNMAVPIPDLHLDDDALSCTLSFNRSPFFCVIPWRAVFALVSEKGQAMVWAEDVPAEVAAQAQAQKPPPERPRGHLRPVGEAESAAAPAPKVSEAVAERGQLEQTELKAVSAKSPAKKVASKSAKAAKAEAAPKRAGKAAAKTSKPAAKKPSAAKKISAEKSPPKKAEAAPAAKQAARPKAAVAEKKTDSAGPESKPKRELPPYLRVVK